MFMERKVKNMDITIGVDDSGDKCFTQIINDSLKVDSLLMYKAEGRVATAYAGELMIMVYQNEDGSYTAEAYQLYE